MAFITINKENFYHNLNQFALKTGSIDKIAIVLKDNAYGHGLELMAKLAYDFGIRHTVVRNRKEADQVASLFETVLILGDKAFPSEKYSFAINALQDIVSMEQGSRVELKVDTGMHRNGIAIREVPEALALIKKHSLVLTGLMTHFRSADELGSELFWQQKQFEKVKAMVSDAGFENIRIHSCNSAATLRMKHFNEDLVRVGIAVYGYNELAAGFDEVNLKPVLSLYARRVSLRQLKRGERVGYGGDFTAPDEMLVSSYDLGYGDGWPRGDTYNPYLTSEGLSILGRVSMDFIALESDKDEVCIMNDAQKAAKHFGTISYEMTTALSPDIERTVI
jgi:alanine racemase